MPHWGRAEVATQRLLAGRLGAQVAPMVHNSHTLLSPHSSPFLLVQQEDDDDDMDDDEEDDEEDEDDEDEDEEEGDEDEEGKPLMI